jgi:hypothetical protein
MLGSNNSEFVHEQNIQKKFEQQIARRFDRPRLNQFPMVGVLML